MLADVRVYWLPSVSEDVVELDLHVQTGDQVVVSTVLSSEATEYVVLGLKEKTNYVVTVTVSDGTTDVSTSLDVNLGDLSAPLPVTGLGFDIVRVYEEVVPA